MLFQRRPLVLALVQAGALMLGGPALAQSLGERTLPAVTVEAGSEQDSATAPVRGFVARRAASATKTDTPLLETPQAISVVTRDRIEAQGAQTLSQVLNYTAGVVSSYFDSRGESLSSRGGNPSQMLDGLQGNFGSYNAARLDPFMLERVEYLRGPASVLYGQGGIGGVLNAVSKRPLRENQRELQLQLGSHQRKQVALDLNQVLDAHWSARVVAIGRDSGSQVAHVADGRQLLAPALTWAPDADTALTLQARQQKDESGSLIGFFPWQGTLLPSRHGQIPTHTFIGEPGWDAYITRQRSLGYLFSHRFSDQLSLRQALRKSSSEVDYRTAYTSFASVPASGRPARPVFNADQRTLNRDLRQQLNRLDTLLVDTQLEAALASGPLRHTLLLGVDSQRARIRQRSGAGVAAPIDVYAPVYGNFTPPAALQARPGSELRQLGLYAQDQIKYGSRWVTVLGLRRDSAQNDVEGDPAARTDDRASSARAGLLYLADGGWSPYASYTESFQPLGGVDVYNKAFLPQRGRQWEGGLKWQPAGAAFSASAALYELRERNRKTADPANPMNSLQLGEVRVRGVELEGAGSVGGAWDWSAAYAYTDARAANGGGGRGKRLSGTPAHNASAWLAHHFALDGGSRFTAGAGVRLIGASYDGTDTLRTPGTALFDAMLAYDSGAWRFALNASNLTDRAQITTCLARGDCFYGQRRTLLASARYLW
ncbi:TonB-dependent siderophore receptor [Janthinobacterium fluminis]